MSQVAKDWEGMPWLVSQAQKGNLVTYNNQANLSRRDVVNNAEVLGPLIAAVGTLSLSTWLAL